ncbi:MAG TPA: 3-dehydroquinate synthase [Bacillota bacterium]|nr:3-dehydroquinate synthase [Bacillota bacterium]HUM55945.1 3-dehydroquinate synthase [Bacillota bacterium]
MNNIIIKTGIPYQVIMEEDSLEKVGFFASDITEPCRICIISDDNVHSLYTPLVESSLKNAGFDVYKIVFPAGEATKDLGSVKKILEYLADENFTRSDVLMALGGGVIGDLTGFAASVFLRGIKYINVPTSFLAAADSSVGGKTGVNLSAGKNLAGTFWQPSLVIYDPKTVKTLSPASFLDGLAESIKCAFIADASLFGFIDLSDMNNETKFVERCVTDSVKVKQFFVENDEYDKGRRQLLNFGHTAGHAIEKLSGFRESHGHAVAQGMVIAARASYNKGWSREDCCSPLIEVLNKYGLSSSCSYSAAELAAAALKDKKRLGNEINLVIPLEIGECALMRLPSHELQNFFEAGLTGR